jgi:predicted ATP-grasp superfamily ATP-dependent carboligase
VRVLVTDAELTLTLAAIRSLARRSVEVVALAPSAHAVGFRSRHVARRLVGPAPGDDDFPAFLAEAVERERVDAVLPVGEQATRALARAEIGAAVAVAEPDALEIAGSKRRTLELARELGVPTPADSGGFPLVAKKVAGSGEVRYLNDEAERRAVEGPDWVIQEYVPGEGRGFFALFEGGRERAVFMHRRLREFPVTGGASTAAESIDDPTLRELGLELLRALRWHGVAMVEFKLDSRDGTYRLMEINPKFWGSLELAIAAGVDFPWLAVRLALGERIEPVRYRTGVRFQWVFRDLLHAAARPSDVPSWLRDLVDPRVRKDVALGDLRPHLAEARATVATIIRGSRDGTLRHPHGSPTNRPA